MFFNISEACTVDKYDFKLKVSESQDSVILHQAGTDNSVKVEFMKASQTEGWKIKLPSEAQMKNTLQILKGSCLSVYDTNNICGNYR